MPDKNSPSEKKGSFVLYTSPDDSVNVDVRFFDESIWMTQKMIAELFEKDRSTVTEHLKNIFNENELDEFSVCRNFRHTAEGHKHKDGI
jgi:hypothetical protein